MKSIRQSLLSITAFAFAATLSFAQPEVKVATVDMPKIFQNYTRAIEATKRLEEESKKAGQEVEAKNREGQQMIQKLQEAKEQAENLTLTEEARSKAKAEAEKLFSEIRSKEEDFRLYVSNTQRAIQQRGNTQQQMLGEEILKKISEVSKRKGITIVFYSTAYADPAYDMSEEVIAELNKDNKGAAAPAAAAPAGGEIKINLPGATN